MREENKMMTSLMMMTSYIISPTVSPPSTPLNPSLPRSTPPPFGMKASWIGMVDVHSILLLISQHTCLSNTCNFCLNEDPIIFSLQKMVCFLLLLIHTMTKNNSGKKGFICFTCSRHSPSLREVRQEEVQGRNLKSRIEAETVEEYCLLVYFSWLSHLTFYTSQGLPRGGTNRSGMGLPLSNG